MKRFLYLLLLLSGFLGAQNKQILYDFSELPQSLLLNPALETNYKYHFGVPVLSGVSAEIGLKGFSLTDIFAVDGLPINTKISSLINQLTTSDFAQINAQIEIINAGFRIRDQYYFSFGFYQEIDGIGYFPKDFFIFFNEGNASNLNRSFNASQIRYKLDVLGVLHAGLSKKINDKLTIGGRIKLYSSTINLESNNNTGTLTTVSGTTSIYRHILSNVNVDIRTSGLIENNKYVNDPGDYLSRTYFGRNANFGFGVDFGVQYKISPQLQFSASLLDFGFINHKNNIKNTKIQGDFVFDGIHFEFDPNSSINYWEQLDERFKQQLPSTEDQESYISWRPAKLNAAIKYSFGEQRSLLCYDDAYKDYYDNAIGAQLFTIFRPLSPQLALTTFYERTITQKTRVKITHTLDSFSATNFGFGFSTQLSKLNFYVLADNLLEFSNLSAANNVSFQLGFNLIFN